MDLCRDIFRSSRLTEVTFQIVIKGLITCIDAFFMDEYEKKIRRRLRDDFSHYASRCLKIRSKSGDICPFVLNKPQQVIHDAVESQFRATGKVRAIILKGRQQGCSTYIEGRFYWRVTHTFGSRAFILTHDTEATNNLFEMAQRYHDHCPIVVKQHIAASNAKELIFSGLDSGYRLGTAGNKAVGRSSTIQLLHGSEVAYWPNAADHAKGIFQAVPNDKGTEVFFESTANGVGNYFHQQWLKAINGESDFIPIFIPWFWQSEYTREAVDNFELRDDEHQLFELYSLSREQLRWRRYKINELTTEGKDGVKAFKQEYPCNAAEAFQMSGENSFIDTEMVMQARHRVVEPYGKLLLGVDPARFGRDRTSIIRRRSNCAYKLENYIKADGMEVAGIVHTIILEEDPHLVFIDTIGLGGPIYDRLCELGHKKKLVSVNSSLPAINQKRYRNKRAEMWGLMRDWFFERNSQIPDDDKLHADICGPEAKRPDSNGRVVLEGKDDMLSRGVRSPDNADALALTFCLPDMALVEERERDYNEVARKTMSGASKIDKLKRSAYSR